MKKNLVHNIIDFKEFNKVINKFQKVFSICYFEVLFDENDAYIETKDDYLFIVSLCDCSMFVTHKDVHTDRVYPKSILRKLDKMKLKYVVDDYCNFV